MEESKKQYFYIDVDLKSMKIVKRRVSNTATLTGDTKDKNIHRIFLTKGQYNKFLGKIKKWKTMNVALSSISINGIEKH